MPVYISDVPVVRRKAAPTRSRAVHRSQGSLTDAAYDLIRRQILTAELEPGRVVTEAELVVTLGIGKTPVREALGRLVLNGLVKNNPRHGYEISVITLKYVQELFGLRMVVEPAAAQLAAGRLDDATLARLDELCNLSYTLGDADSLWTFIQLNHEFHVLVAATGGNERLAGIVGQLLDESERIFHISLRRDNRAELISHSHREFVDILKSGDSDRAWRFSTETIVNQQRRVVDGLLWTPPLTMMPGSRVPALQATA